eukprot:13650839-Alexandrium_andersonii.AAC.1
MLHPEQRCGHLVKREGWGPRGGFRHQTEHPPRTHLVVQAATVHGIGGWLWRRENPSFRPGDPGEIRDQLHQSWELNPYRAFEPEWCRPLDLRVRENVARGIVAEVHEAERAWNGRAFKHPLEVYRRREGVP